MFFVLSFFNATFLNSYTASTVGDREKKWHRDGTVSFTVPVKDVSIWPTIFFKSYIVHPYILLNRSKYKSIIIYLVLYMLGTGNRMKFLVLQGTYGTLCDAQRCATTHLKYKFITVGRAPKKNPHWMNQGLYNQIVSRMKLEYKSLQLINPVGREE